jgi:hypothetical protein
MSVVSYRSAPSSEPAGRERLLLGMGVVLICLGAITAFLSLAVVFAPLTDARAGSVGPAFVARLAPRFLLLAGLATGLIWTGIASIRLQRWVRPVVMSVAGMVLFMVGCAALQWLVGWVVPDIDVGPTPSVRRRAVRGPAPVVAPETVEMIGTVLGVLLATVLPGVFFVIYRARSVRRTLEEADPGLSWADRCPVPTLAAALGLGYAAFLCLLAIFTGTFPFFGDVLQGPLAVAAWAGVAALTVGAGLLVYRQNLAGPWLAIALVALGTTTLAFSSAAATQADPFAYQQTFRAFQSVQAAQVRATRSIVSVGSVAVPMIVYLLYVRRLPRRAGVVPPRLPGMPPPLPARAGSGAAT